MTVREGAWDCDVCGRIGNRGPERHCAGCGHPRGEEVKLYLPEGAREVVDRAALDRALAGPDWTCEHCEGDNRAEYAHCTGCGAPRGDSPEREVVDHLEPVSASAARPESAKQAQAALPARPSKARRKELREASRRRGRKRGCGRPVLVGLLILAAMVALVSWCSRTEESTATVTGFSWQRTIPVEDLVTVAGEAMPSQVPEGARRLEPAASGGGTHTVTERVQVGTERVLVGVRDLGNGYFEDLYEERPVYELQRRQVPVRGPPAGGKVRYELERWETVREATAAGQGRSPSWPDPELAAGEREGKRTQVLTVHFAGPEGERLRYSAKSEAEWRRFEVGQTYRVEAARSGTIRSVAPR